MIIGIHSRDNDLAVNPTKAKQLTNVRAAGSDENLLLTPPIRLSLEEAIGFINEDELVEVTPKTIRLRKKFLLEHERKKQAGLLSLLFSIQLGCSWNGVSQRLLTSSPA